ncbi:RNA-dependent RNA polymerase [Wuhan Insect virus 2]|uniref:RNA-directed RNA polymerase L n=1 Tax=Wuhan Insect virus 2 TaxID=1608107 RepID=A0A0B5KTW4_9VIRU|nr:RNA-dependent RNA polymerase [Wuhan Insect virus 2]AJG39262.1 RNA-dependent RNA polymerase [Wuhan Insect virus 2]
MDNYLNVVDYSDAQACSDEVSSLLFKRHEVAGEYVNIALARVVISLVTDDVNINEWILDNDLNPLSKNYKKTPDLIFIYGRSIFIGDIAVTRTVKSVEAIKSKKYDELRTLIQSANPHMTVEELNLIFDENGTNISDISRKLRSWFTGGWSERAAMEFKSTLCMCTDKISEIEANVRDYPLFLQYRNEQNSNNPNLIDSMLDKSLADEDIYDKKYQPVYSELDLFNMAFEHSKGVTSSMDKMSEIKDLSDTRKELDTIIMESYDKRDIRSPLQYVFNLENEETQSGIDLIESYYHDITMGCDPNDQNRLRFLSVLPHGTQIDKMKNIDNEYKTRRLVFKEETMEGNFANKMKEKYGQKHAYYAPETGLAFNNRGEKNMLRMFIEKSKTVNFNTRPKSIYPEDYQEAIKNTKELISYLSRENGKGHTSTNLTFDVPSGRRSTRELENIQKILPIYETINKRNGVILLTSIVKWIQDIVRIKIGNNTGIYYSVPIQKNMIMCTITGNSMYGNNPHYNYFSMTRFEYNETIDNSKLEILNFINSVFNNMICCHVVSKQYIYIMSKLQKTTLDKLEKIVTVDYEMRSHAMAMGILFNETTVLDYDKMFNNKYYDINQFNNTDEFVKKAKSVYDSTNNELSKKNIINLSDYFNEYIGANALIMLDLHQKPSEILDLMKYLSGINFSELSNIRTLLKDKLTMMRKTSLDVFLIEKMLAFCERNIRIQSYCRPCKILMSDTGIIPSSFNVTGIFSSFWHEELYTSSLNFYYSEAQLIFQARPKKLYNEQYMAKACLKVLENNKKFELEEKEAPGSCSKGMIYRKFNFNSSFNYSRDAIYYAQELMNKTYRKFAKSQKMKIAGKLQEIGISNVSMRGSCKLEENMRAGQGKSQTSLYSCLEYLSDMILRNDTKSTKLIELVKGSKHRNQCYNMSSKEQRGGGRPIGSPDFPSKQELYLVESVYKILSIVQNENLLVKGVNRSAKIASINRTVISKAYSERYKEIRHIVMDQSQFSEGDNVNKFCDFIWFNENIPSRLKRIMIESEKKHMNRRQYWPLLPLDAEKNYPGMVLPLNGTVGKAGWVQGMKNIISTYAHIAAVTWIIDIFNKYYFTLPGNDMYGEHKGLLCDQIVNSDDSYIIVAFKHIKPIHDFYSFMISAKRLFRLEQNTKKSYITGTIGEIIQKYVANGTIVNIWSKSAVSSFRNNMGVDMARDVSNSVSALGSLMREGAPETMCTYIRAELKNQIFRLYNIGKGRFNDLSEVGIENYRLPCELGGWPTQVTTYELCVAGLQAQLDYCKEYYKQNQDCNEYKIVSCSIQLNMMRFTERDIWQRIKASIGVSNTRDLISQLPSLKVSNIDMSKSDDEGKALKLLQHMMFLDYKYLEKENKVFDLIKPQIKGQDNGDATVSNEFNISNEGLTSYDSSFARSTINCINWIINVPERVTKTLEIMKRFEHLKPSGLAGLYKERMSIQTGVADLIDQSNSMIIKLSEMNYTKSIRQKAAANAFAATQRCCSISGIPYKMSIVGVYFVLLGLSDRLGSIFNKNISAEFVIRVMTDPTSRADIARDIVQNYEKETEAESDSYVANKLPRSEDDIILHNDIQSVLVEMVKPGHMKDQGYIIRYEARLNADVETIKLIYKDWIEISKNMVNTVRTIYFHYISVRRSRYIIAPQLETKNMNDALLSIFEKCQNIATKNIGVYRKPKSNNYSVKRTEETRTIINNLMGGLEVVMFLEKNYNVPATESMKEIEMHIGLESGCLSDLVLNQDLFGMYYNLSTPYEKKYLALLSHTAGDSTYLSDATKHNEFNIEWEKEQNFIVSAEGRKIYVGHFRVLISKGNDTVAVDGEPGNIKCVYTTTYNIKFITDALFYFLKKTPFDGYPRPVEKKQWGNSTFWNSKNSTTSLKLMYSRFGETRIERNEENTIDRKMGKRLVYKPEQNSLQIAVDTPTNYVTYIPLEYNHNLNGSVGFGVTYNEFLVSDNKVFGLKYKTDLRSRTDPITGKRYTDNNFKREKCFLFGYKDAHKSSSYSMLDFTNIMIDTIKLSSLAKYGMLKNLILGELIKSSRNQIVKFMTNEVNPSLVVVETIKRAISAVSGVDIPSTLDTSTNLSVETIGISLDNDIMDNIKDLDDDEEIIEDIILEEDEEEYGGVNFGLNLAKSIPSILAELSMITVDVSKARMVVDTFFGSEISNLLTDNIIEIENKVNNISGIEVDDWAESVEAYNDKDITLSKIDSRLYNILAPIIDLEHTSSDSIKRENMNTLIVAILSSGLLSKETWHVKDIKKKVDTYHYAIKSNTRYVKQEYTRDAGIELYFEYQIIKTLLDRIYKNRMSDFDPDAPPDFGSSSGSGSTHSTRGNIADQFSASRRSSSGSIEIWS